jgi:tRNA threonylcarbamoyl adenosine modification protein YjeE
MTAPRLTRVVPLAQPADTEGLGAALASAFSAEQSAVVHLVGELGAGKTSLARALLRGLGVNGPIRSPTYTLLERYPLASGGEAAHLDLYRIIEPDELEYLALDELSASARLWLVEWPQRGGGRLPAADLRIGLALAGDGRRAELVALTDAGQRWLRALDHSM